MSEIMQHIPPGIIKFLVVVSFSLLIGLEQRRHHIKDELETLFGTDRTFTLIGVLGYILYVISPENLLPFIGGGAVITVFLAIYYYQKISVQKKFGGTTVTIALITYCLAPLVFTQPHWLALSVVVLVLVITEIKGTLFKFSEKFDDDEFITLAKFLILAGVILPLLPDKPISETINISPYKFWLAIVAVSGISYLSYLVKKFIFPQAGIILTGILGGLYSSTATTIILARKSKEMDENNRVVSAMLLATMMMYLRIFLLALFFNQAIAMKLAPSFAVFVVVTGLLAVYFFKFHKGGAPQAENKQTLIPHNNPLEFKTAMLFAALFIFFALATGFVNKHYGSGGITVLSFVVGVTDIDPFIINLFQSKWNIEITFLVMAVLNAVSSNNLLKMIYAITLSDKSIRWQLITAFGILIVLGLGISFGFYFR